MSKVISFSISDRYLDKLRTLYPALTDNLAAKQFLTDGLESSLGNSLDGSLDAELDGKLKSLIESELDDLLDERLDATVGKLLTSLSDRLSRLEEKLDDSLDGSLDEMERLLKLQREASIATSPLPTGEPVEPAIEDLPTVESVEPISTIETVASAIEDPEKKIMEPVGGSDSLDTLPVPPITDKTIDQNAIETVPGETDSSIETVTDAIELTNREKAAILGIGDSNLSKWLKNGEIPKKYDNKCRFNENKTKIILI